MKTDEARQAGAPLSEPFPDSMAQERGKTPEQAPNPGQSLNTVLAMRYGRGRLGGSGVILTAIQRARFHGRRIKPMEGDLKSRTLASYYPSHAPDGRPILDGATMPRSENLGDFKSWIGDTMDDMAEDRISRALDISGGDRVMQELLADLSLSAFCGERGFKFLALCMLGSDMEDFNHIRAAVDAGVLHPMHMILIMNEGAIRSGQNPDGAFDAIVGHPDYQALTDSGAVPVYLPRLPCMDALREQRLNFYDVAANRPGSNGKRPRATMQHMTNKWLGDFEAQHVLRDTAGRLP
jgi:hypothetical protein